MHHGRSSVMHCLHCRFRVLHHIGSGSNPDMTLEEPSRLLDRDILHAMPLNKTHKDELRPFFIDICPSVSANEKQGVHTPLLYNTIFTSSGFS